MEFKKPDNKPGERSVIKVLIGAIYKNGQYFVQNGAININKYVEAWTESTEIPFERNKRREKAVDEEREDGRQFK